MKLKSVFFLALMLVRVCCFALSSEEEEFTSRVKVKTYYDGLLWIGLDMPKNFDPQELTQSEASKALERGLSLCEENARNGVLLSQCLLAEYYFESGIPGHMRKALYWAHLAAEQGSLGSMTILREAYGSGKGVVQDIGEGLKWCFLAAALGDRDAKQKADDLMVTTDEYCRRWADEGLRRANLWMQQHPKVFFSPD